jgi:phosphatidylglycerophosphate synthase
MRPDVYFCYVTGALWVVVLGLYGLRLATRGGFHSDRVERMGGSPLVGRGLMDMTYWAIEPLVRGLVRLGVTPNGLTWSSLVLGVAAGVAIAGGWFGLACLLATSSTIGDILDGQVARSTGGGSDRGELLDAAVDRYTEFAMIAGLGLVLHDSQWQLCLALGAMLASFLVSYATAKAEALKVKPPRGMMRRHERGIYLIVGLGLVPLLGPTCVAHDLPYATPSLVALAIIAAVGNVAALVRFVHIARSLP